ncbi:MAG: hypothetical protein O3A47_10515, partial [Chloroflexi bacterium]|nr:hypothetical protein [Chloroflexota bacterium]
FKESPVSGVGLRQAGVELKARLPESRAAQDTHSGYVQLLVETGLLGMVPYGLLLLYVSYLLVRNVKEEPSDQSIWRAAFLGAFIGMVIDTAFGTYHFDRYFWIPIAYAAMLEASDRQPRRSAAPSLRLSGKQVSDTKRFHSGDGIPDGS